MLIPNSELLKQMLTTKGYDALAEMPSFEVDQKQFEDNLDELRHQHHHHDDAQLQARAVYRILTHKQNGAVSQPASEPADGTVAKVLDDVIRTFRQQIGVLAGKTSVVEEASANVSNGLMVSMQAVQKAEETILNNMASLKDSVNLNTRELSYLSVKMDEAEKEAKSDRKKLKWAIIVGILALAFLVGVSVARAETEPVNVVAHDQVIRALIRLRPSALASPEPQVGGSTYARMQFVSGGAFVNVSSSAPLPMTCISGCSGGGGGGGTSSDFGDPFPTAGTAAGFIDAGGDMAGATLDAGGRLITTGAGGTFPVTGTFWQATQPVSGTFWQATQPISGAISFTAPQHVILDSGHSIIDTGSTTAVTQATGTNLHAVLDTTSTTAVTQATATNLNAAVVGTGTAGTPAGNILTVQGVTSMTPILATVSDGTGALNVIVDSSALPSGASTLAEQQTQTTSLGTLAGAVSSSVVQSNTKQVNGVTTLAGAGAVGTGSQRVAVGQDATTIAGSAPGTAGTASSNVVTVQGIASGTPQGVSVASGGIASGAVASGAIASGAIASGAVASGAVASGAFAAGSIAAGAVAAGATSFVKLEDVASAGADAGVPAMAVQLATPADTAADGDYSMLQMSAGRLWTATLLPAETTKVIGTVRTVGNVGGVFDTTQNATVPANAISMGCNFTTAPSSVTTGNQGAAQCNSKGELLTQLTDGTTNVAVIAGTTALKTDMSSVAGTATVTAGVSGMLAVGGNTATNVAITSNPVLIGAQAVTSENSAATTARGVQLTADKVGKLIVMPYANPENFVSGVITSAMTGTTSTSLVAAPAGSLRNYITQITCSNSHATVGTDIIIQDGNAGTTIYLLPAAAVFGGAALSFPVPLKQPTAATALYVANVTTGANTKCAASGYSGL